MARILLIDDDLSFRNFIKSIIPKYEIEEAGSGAEGLQKIATDTYALIILDIFMPSIDGLDFLEQSASFRSPDTPVLVISSIEEPDIILHFIQLGGYDCINKSLHYKIIRKKIETGLQLYEQRQNERKMEEDIRSAEITQKLMIPKTAVLGNTYKINVFSKFIGRIGGDVLDYILFRDGRLTFYVADIMGHGISAALHTMMIKLLFDIAIKQTDTPGEILKFANQELVRLFPNGAFVTCFFGIIDPAQKKLFYASAGHMPPFLLHNSVLRELDGRSKPLGAFPDIPYQTHSENFYLDDLLLVYTDGIIERKNLEGELKGKQFALDLYRDTSLPYAQKFDKLVEAIEQDLVYKLADDCTVLQITGLAKC